MPRKDDDDITTDSSDVSSDDTTTGDETTETTTDSDDDESSSANFSPAQSAAVIKNAPHDEEFTVAGAPTTTGAAPAPAPARQPAAAQPSGGGIATSGSAVQNQPHDEEFSVTGGGGMTSTATKPAPVAQQQQQQAQQRRSSNQQQQPVGGARGGMIQNDHADEFEDVEDDMTDEDDVPTPQKAPTKGAGASGSGAGAAPAGGQVVRNEHFDEEYTVAGGGGGGGSAAVNTSAGSLGSVSSGKPPGPLGGLGGAPAGRAPQQQPPQALAAGGSMAPPSDSDDEDDSDATSESDEGEAPMMQNVRPAQVTATTAASNSVEYNPADYAHITNSAPADVRDLFAYIQAYQPTTIELPAKLKPFVPDYIPSVGDIDTFCKVPRPDDKPDNFGLTVVDEPSSKMSNPAIIASWLAGHENVSQKFIDGILDSLEDAANRPQAVDKWIQDLRETQAQKAPPTVYYSKPMPSIDGLMQAWPPGFEQVLNSDLQLPPPNIDLDIEQYVRMLCAILDVPVHNNLVESLHVVFSLYLEFRENQHFKAS